MQRSIRSVYTDSHPCTYIFCPYFSVSVPLAMLSSPPAATDAARLWKLKYLRRCTTTILWTNHRKQVMQLEKQPLHARNHDLLSCRSRSLRFPPQTVLPNGAVCLSPCLFLSVNSEYPVTPVLSSSSSSSPLLLLPLLLLTLAPRLLLVR